MTMFPIYFAPLVHCSWRDSSQRLSLSPSSLCPTSILRLFVHPSKQYACPNPPHYQAHPQPSHHPLHSHHDRTPHHNHAPTPRPHLRHRARVHHPLPPRNVHTRTRKPRPSRHIIIRHQTRPPNRQNSAPTHRPLPPNQRPRSPALAPGADRRSMDDRQQHLHPLIAPITPRRCRIRLLRRQHKVTRQPPLTASLLRDRRCARHPLQHRRSGSYLRQLMRSTRPRRQ